jgi:type VI protein secretion system component VasA
LSQDQSRRQELANKFPEVEQHFQEIKQEIYEPQIERLGETTKEQKKRAQEQRDLS